MKPKRGKIPNKLIKKLRIAFANNLEINYQIQTCQNTIQNILVNTVKNPYHLFVNIKDGIVNTTMNISK